MKIVCDANMTFGREAFETLGNVECIDGRQIEPRHVADADILVTRSTTKINAELLEGSQVRFYGSGVIGTDHIDISFMEKAGIPWAGAPGCNALGVAQYILSGLVRLAISGGHNLKSMTLGIVGVGNVGRRVEEYARAIGMQVVCCDPPRQRDPSDLHAQSFVTLEELLTRVDIVTLHVPLTHRGPDATHKLLDERRLRLMSPDSWLINAARGSIIDSDAWLEARNLGRLAGTILDTWDPEPNYRPDLLACADWGTPHIAGYSFEGKVNGTMQVYHAACQFLGVAPTFTPPMPQPPVPRLDIDAAGLSLEQLLKSLVLPTYDIAIDDDAMRSTVDIADDSDRAKAFNKLRSSYPMRREFAATSVTLRNATQEQLALVRDLGFDA